MMLGRLYDKIDKALGKPIDAGEVFGIEEAASLILAEILDRADILYTLLALGSMRGMNDEEVTLAVTIFKRDCDEARARAERLGLTYEQGSWTESSGERAFMGFSEKVTVHPYAHARWHERLTRQVERNPVPESARRPRQTS